MAYHANDALLMEIEARLAAIAPGRFAYRAPLDPSSLGPAWQYVDTTDGHLVYVLAPDTSKLMLQGAEMQAGQYLENLAQLSARLYGQRQPVVPEIRLVDAQGQPPLLIRTFHEGITFGEFMRRSGSGRPVTLSTASLQPAFLAIAESLARAHQAGVAVPGMSIASVLLVEPKRGSHDPRALFLELLPSPLSSAESRLAVPEEVAGESSAATSADCYRLGALMYQALTGFAPFMDEFANDEHSGIGESEKRAFLKQWQMYRPHPTPIRQLKPNIPAALGDTIMRLLAREPHARPTAAQLVKDLYALDRPGLPLPPALQRLLGTRATKAVAAAEIPVPVTAAVSTVEFDSSRPAPSGAAAIAPSPEDREFLPEPRTARRWQRPAGVALALLLLVALAYGMQARQSDRGTSGGDTEAMLRDLPKDLEPVTLAQVPPPVETDKPHEVEAAQDNPPHAEAEPVTERSTLPHPPRPDPREEATPPEPEPAPEAKPALPRVAEVIPPRAVTPTPRPRPRAEQREPLPNPNPKPEATAPEPAPEASAEETPKPAAVPTEIPSTSPSASPLFDLDTPIKQSETRNTPTPAIDLPGNTPAPQPNPSPTKAVLPSSSGNPLHQFNAHEKQVWSVDISPDGRTIASGGRDENAALWDINGGTLRGQLKAGVNDHTNWITAVSYSRDGRWLATGSEDAMVKIWDLTNGRKLAHTFRTPGDSVVVRCLDFDPSTNKLVVGYGNGKGSIRMLEVGSWKEIPTPIKQHGAVLRALSVSHDGKYLATGGDDNEARLWNLKTGKLIKTLSGHRGWVQSLAFSGHGHLATGSSDGSLRIWSVTDGSLIGIIPNAHKGGVYAVAFRNSDGRLLATGGADRVVRLWDMEDGSSKGNFSGHLGIVTSLVFTPQGNRLVTATLQDPYSGESAPNIRVYRVN